jgi:hypothetical protein
MTSSSVIAPSTVTNVNTNNETNTNNNTSTLPIINASTNPIT